MKRTIIFCSFFISLLLAGNLPFDAYRAFSYLEKQVNFGPRIPGSPGQIVCRDWLIEKSKTHADTVIVQQY
ncbi:MAG: hypothetical protein J7M01_00745, partial [Candidatus Marinimicrobia bacterium]|nr:hypothetical protein [Candidatus Neomarinimicrobiota bacterium]